MQYGYGASSNCLLDGSCDSDTEDFLNCLLSQLRCGRFYVLHAKRSSFLFVFLEIELLTLFLFCGFSWGGCLSYAAGAQCAHAEAT